MKEGQEDERETRQAIFHCTIHHLQIICHYHCWSFF